MLARVALAAIIAGAPAAHGHVTQTRVVSADPVDYTPHVLDGIVNAIAVVGRTAVVGGSFSEVSDAARAEVVPRDNLFAFDLPTGRVLPDFAPVVTGPVYGLAAGDQGTVYLGGEFYGVDNVRARGLARVRLSDGALDTGFAPQLTGGSVSAVVRQGRALYVGGDFTGPREGLARLDAATGAADPGFAVTPGAPLTSRVKVYALALSRGRLAVDGSFTTLDGQSRPQLGLIDVSGPTARVAPWRTDAYARRCAEAFPSYVRGLDFSPDGSYFVVVTTGGPRGGMCDTAARFETYAKGSAIRPTWVNATGGDSLYAVAVTGAAVYVGGHQRWLNNPRGRDTAGPGAVSREGIGAIHPRTGMALGWNPTRERGIGVKAFSAQPGGLLVGSDTTRLGREYHARIGMFPLP
ncbi:delta-60 repeat domain-containing protein [Actinomadura sp. ATCC 31491]|uniref:Delta-60 repeat domain-containing protein n=1 Tax=Actinomadura luzonensis TaxID=2805427 RepID=A0ABT0FQP6_9ACTN|nr:delta-60 repeat domain-containing protein [Actinomadura luzonensis]MCK2214660.1 delta-60 repeat domain-containing protein [Actinomadura luzonensis]